MLPRTTLPLRSVARLMRAAPVQNSTNNTLIRGFASTVHRNKGVETVFTPKGVKPIGPYSQAVKANGFVFVSGQIPAETNGTIIQGTIQEKTHKMCQNAKAVLEAAGSSLENVVQVTIFFENLDDAKPMNEVYSLYFPHNPTRTSCEAKRVPAGAGFIMELVAVQNGFRGDSVG